MGDLVTFPSQLESLLRAFSISMIFTLRPKLFMGTRPPYLNINYMKLNLLIAYKRNSINQKPISNF